jgi:hypothetical protein
LATLKSITTESQPKELTERNEDLQLSLRFIHDSLDTKPHEHSEAKLKLAQHWSVNAFVVFCNSQETSASAPTQLLFVFIIFEYISYLVPVKFSFFCVRKPELFRPYDETPQHKRLKTVTRTTRLQKKEAQIAEEANKNAGN